MIPLSIKQKLIIVSNVKQHVNAIVFVSRHLDSATKRRFFMLRPSTFSCVVDYTTKRETNRRRFRHAQRLVLMTHILHQISFLAYENEISS
jgi:hypothetical protein